MESLLDRNPLDLIERNLILPSFVELARPRLLVVGDVTEPEIISALIGQGVFRRGLCNSSR